MSTTTARTAAIAALTLACAAAGPAAWACDKGDHSTRDHSAGSKSGAGSHRSAGTSHSSPSGDHNPPGNNGTVKIHQLANDTSPHNVPHVTCDFYITFFGFDTNQTADVSLAGQAPTGKGTPLWSQDGALISTDAAGGGTDVDEEIHLTAAQLGLDRLGAPHPKQGYHVKLTVDVNGAPGDAKHKVFWIKPCDSVSGTTGGLSGESTGTATGSAQGGVSGTTTGTTTGTATGTPGVAVEGEQQGTGGTPAVAVLGEQLTRGSNANSSGVLGSSTGLPFTGAPLLGLLAAGGLAAAGGAALVHAGRRREDAV